MVQCPTQDTSPKQSISLIRIEIPIQDIEDRCFMVASGRLHLFLRNRQTVN